jgi:hypothetical protein
MDGSRYGGISAPKGASAGPAVHVVSGNRAVLNAWEPRAPLMEALNSHSQARSGVMPREDRRDVVSAHVEL